MLKNSCNNHCTKSIYSVNLHIYSKYKKIRTRKNSVFGRSYLWYELQIIFLSDVTLPRWSDKSVNHNFRQHQSDKSNGKFACCLEIKSKMVEIISICNLRPLTFGSKRGFKWVLPGFWTSVSNLNYRGTFKKYICSRFPSFDPPFPLVCPCSFLSTFTPSIQGKFVLARTPPLPLNFYNCKI